MENKIGAAAGEVWQALNIRGELSLIQLKKQVGISSPVVDWAIGWLAREDKLIISAEKRSYRFRLKEGHSKAAL